MTRRIGWVLLLLVATASVVALASSYLYARDGQSGTASKQTDPWEKLRFLVGSWEGTGRGDPGESTVERTYEFVLNDQFLFTQNKSVFKPQEKNPKGETHEDWGLMSYDRGRRKIVFRQFHVEGFINQYVLEEVSADGKTLVFVTEHVENGPPGFRARLTYKIKGDNEFAETFELAPAGAKFKPCVQVEVKRTK
jgi:hypothetical protein